MAEWARIVNTTIKKYVRGFEDDTMRNRKVLAVLKKRGRIKYNVGGDGLNWKVKYRRATMTENNGEQTLEFSRQNRFKSADLDYQGYAVVDSMTKRERLKNRGVEAIVKLYSETASMLLDDLEDQFAEEIYVDSSASGNSGRVSGIETMMAATQTITVSSGAARTANAADPAGYPNDTYAGLSTVLGNYSGSWDTQSNIDTTWPFGTGTADFDFWSPVIVNYTSTAFDGSSSTWAANAVTSTRFGIEAINGRNKGESGVSMVLLDRGLYRKYKDKLDSKERISIDSSLDLRSLGFGDVIHQDGVEISSEYGVPGAVGYLWSMNNLELCSMQDSLFDVEGPDYDMGTRSWRWAVDFLGQFRFKSPRFFGKLVALA